MDTSNFLTKKYPAITIADYLIEKARSQGDLLSPLKLIKLVYFAYGWFLSITNKQLINEPIEAWQYGPVVPSLYHAFKHYGNREITEYNPNKSDLERLKQDQATVAFLDKIWEVYGSYSAIQLSNMTHETGSPWDIAWNQNHGRYWNNHPIDDELIQRYFLKCNAEAALPRKGL